MSDQNLWSLGTLPTLSRDMNRLCDVKSRDEGAVFSSLFAITSSQKHLEFIPLLVTDSIERCQLYANFLICLLGSTSLNLALAKKSGDMQDERLTGYIKTLEINKRISKA